MLRCTKLHITSDNSRGDHTIGSPLCFFSSFNQDLSCFLSHLSPSLSPTKSLRQCSAATPAETPFPDRNTRHPIVDKTPFAILASPRLFLSQPRDSTLEFADVGIMRPQPVNNETKDVAHQLRSIYCLASISSPHPPLTPPSSIPPPCICVCFYFAAACEMPFLCYRCRPRLFSVCTASARKKKKKKNKHLKI